MLLLSYNKVFYFKGFYMELVVISHGLDKFVEISVNGELVFEKKLTQNGGTGYLTVNYVKSLSATSQTVFLSETIQIEYSKIYDKVILNHKGDVKIDILG
jgi:hypothetical protein